jgi:hypothetical protein
MPDRRTMSGAWTPEQFDAAMAAKPVADLDDVMRVLVWLVEASSKPESRFQIAVAMQRMEQTLANKALPR